MAIYIPFGLKSKSDTLDGGLNSQANKRAYTTSWTSMGEMLDITLFSPGGLHDEAVEPIATEAEGRGHNVRFSRDTTESAEVGIYTQHTHKIPAVNADLSVISFHGIDQGYHSLSSENWSRFDVGLLPSEVAAKNWQQDSARPTVRPNIGVFTVGWPKSDLVFRDEFDEEVQRLTEKYGIMGGKTTIYAPTVENDGKIHQYVDAARDVADSILVKHAPYESKDRLDILYEEYEDDDKVKIFDPSEPIFPALATADVLVSDESSVLQEAILTETIPISVTDWPMRNRERTYPGVQLPDFAYQTECANLKSTLQNVFDQYEKRRSNVISQRDSHYANLGESSKIVVDLLEALASNENLPVEPVTPSDSQSNTVQQAYLNLRMSIARPYHRTRAAFVSRLSEKHIDLLEKIHLHKLLHTLDRLFGKRKYR